MSDEGGQRQIVYSICVSGASYGETVDRDSEKARQLGESIARAGHTLTTGATVGLPYYAALGASAAGGKNIGFSPAVSLREHIKKYRLPYNCYDFINFTGLNYVGRDLYLVQSSDAVITIGGRFGSLHEFTSALESHKPCGVLIGSGGTADLIPRLMQELSPPHNSMVVYSDDPHDLVNKVLGLLKVKNEDLRADIEKYDDSWFLDQKNDQHHAG